MRQFFLFIVLSAVFLSLVVGGVYTIRKSEGTMRLVGIGATMIGLCGVLFLWLGVYL